MKPIEVNRTLYRFGECSTEIEGNTFKKGESVKNLLFSGIVPLHNVRVQSEEKIRLVRVENGEPGYEAGNLYDNLTLHFSTAI